MIEIRVGCILQSLEEWLVNFEQIGAENEYTPTQIEEYGEHLHYIQRWLAKQEELKK